MIPKLYDEDYAKSETLIHGDTEKNGYGFLNTCQKCIVHENTSGVFTLDMEILTSDKYAEYVLPNTFIKIKPNKLQDSQLFQVFKVTESKNKLSVSANHIKYLALNNMISGYNRYKTSSTGMSLVVPHTFQGTAQEIFNIFLKSDRYLLFEEYSNSTIPSDKKCFDFVSDIDVVTKTVRPSFFADKTLGEFFYDKQYGMGQFNGEWLYDNFKLYLLIKRGKQHAVKLRDGYDYKDIIVEYSSDNNYNVVVPYAKIKNLSVGEVSEFSLSGEPYYLDNDEVNKYPRLKIVDVSEHTPDLKAYTSGEGIGGGMIDAFDAINSTFSGEYYRGKYKARGYEIAVTAELNYNSETVQGLGLYDPVILVTPNGREIISSVSGISFDAINERVVDVEMENKRLTLKDVVAKQRR